MLIHIITYGLNLDFVINPTKTSANMHQAAKPQCNVQKKLEQLYFVLIIIPLIHAQKDYVGLTQAKKRSMKSDLFKAEHVFDYACDFPECA